MGKSFSILAIGFLMAIATVSCGAKQENNPGSHLEAFDIHGNVHRLDKWIGRQPVVLNFWGTWCGPCRREVPDLVRVYSEFSPRGIVMLGLAVNDDPRRVEQYARQQGMTWQMLMASSKLVTWFGATAGVPTTVFLDRNGRVVKRFVGAQTYESLKSGFEALLEGS
jgi:thiol-disulfide isomerase/thioredoxin